MIRLEDYGWKFDGSERWTLDGVTLEIAPGECVLLAGPSGAGKSTLLLALAALLKGRHGGASSGRLYLAKTDITDASPQAVAGIVALVQQNPDANFATLSVQDEVAFALENQCLERDAIVASVDRSLRWLGLESLRTRQLSTLSEGQKQRVALAAALACEPKILILDEPTASLDPDSIGEVLQALERLIENEDMTVIIAEQRLHEFAALKPRVVVLDGGKVAGDSPWSLVPAEIREPFRLDVDPAEPPTDPDERNAPRMTAQALRVERGDARVLDDVSVEVGQGEVVGLMGPNGSGKSTLLLALMGLIPIQSGKVVMGETDVRAGAPYNLGREAGLVFQNPDHQLFADSVRAEALFAAENFGCAGPTVDDKATALLEQAGLSERVEDHPYRLSYGQKRRLNIVASVLHDIKLLLLDEPFIGQDRQNAAWLIATVKRLALSGIGVLMVVHDPHLAQACCDRIVFLKSGRVLMAEPLPQAWNRLAELDYGAYLPASWRQHDAARSD